MRRESNNETVVQKDNINQQFQGEDYRVNNNGLKSLLEHSSVPLIVQTFLPDY